ncbi:MAG: hypothetical protein IJD43_02735 [Thermoguttaceae bacterium]|nr:hypothetical protein [Thermoguttaceae bacterium]
MSTFPTSTTTIPFNCPTCGCGEQKCHTAWVHCRCCGNESFLFGTETEFRSGDLDCPECQEPLWVSNCSGHIYPSGAVDTIFSYTPIGEELGYSYYRAVHKTLGVYRIWDDLVAALMFSDDKEIIDHCGNIYERGDSE